MGAFKEPHGGELKYLYLPADEAEAEKEAAGEYASWDLTERQLCDIELLLNGAFSPLDGFLNKDDYESVVKKMRLKGGVLWPIPVTLDVTEEFAANVKPGDKLALRDLEGVILATLEVGDLWTPDLDAEAKGVYGTTDEKHPAVNYLKNIGNPVYVGGTLRGIEEPTHYDYKHLRDTPYEIRDRFKKLGWRKVVAFQTRNPMHRAHQELTLRAARDVEANLLIHPVVGMTKPGDVDHFTRVRCYEQLLGRYPEQTTMLSLLPLAMRMGGPREALWHAIIRKNYGCTHLIVGRDHAGPGQDSKGKDFYGPYDAQELLKEHADELDITMVPFQLMVYAENRAQYIPIDEAGDDDNVLNISGTELRRRLQEGLDIPEWFSFPDVVAELRRTHPPRHKQGYTVFFTGLSGDGDIVRKNLSSELGFSKEHRDLNIRRIGYVASEITKNGGIAICAPIAPYTATRRAIRESISAVGGFVEIHVATSLEECEQRDRKGLYALARAGKIKEFTGISDPYEVPENAEMVIDTVDITPDLAAHRILVKLKSMGFIR
jgi:sulfate adenylyltransferase